MNRKRVAASEQRRQRISRPGDQGRRLSKGRSISAAPAWLPASFVAAPAMDEPFRIALGSLSPSGSVASPKSGRARMVSLSRDAATVLRRVHLTRVDRMKRWKMPTVPGVGVRHEFGAAAIPGHRAIQVRSVARCCGSSRAPHAAFASPQLREPPPPERRERDVCAGPDGSRLDQNDRGFVARLLVGTGADSRRRELPGFLHPEVLKGERLAEAVQQEPERLHSGTREMRRTAAASIQSCPWTDPP